MNEVTNITTVQLTKITKMDDAKLLESIKTDLHPKTVQEFEGLLKEFFGIDDVKIISNQFFVNEKGDFNG